MRLSKSITGVIIVSLALMLGACGHHTVSHTAKKNTTNVSKVKKSSKAIRSSLVMSSITSSSINSEEQNSTSTSQVASKVGSNSNSISAQQLTPQQLGILVTMNQDPALLKGVGGKLGGPNGGLWYGTPDQGPNSGETAGFYCMTTDGDGELDLYYKLDGNNVIIKKDDPNSGSCVADYKMMTLTIPVSQIMRNYTTPQQQNIVNNYANRIQNISQVNN